MIEAEEPDTSAPVTTIRDVARRAQVSLGTVSNFLNETKPIAEPTRRRIERAISELNFIPNAGVRVMRGGRSRVVGFMLPDSANPFFSEVSRGIQARVIEAGLVVVTCDTDGLEERENHFSRILSEMRVVGTIVTASSASERQLQRLADSGSAIVILEPGPERTRFSTVEVDDFHGGYLAMEHLVRLGHREVVLIGGPGGAPQIQARFDGARAAFERAGLEPGSLHRVDAEANSITARLAAAESARSRYPNATAAFCANDLLALVLEVHLLRTGVRVPEDFAIVGYDDIENAQVAQVPLTTIRQPQFAIGQAAAQLVLDLAEGAPGPLKRSFTPELVVRGSTI